ncbi:hypothetical protein [Paludibaculum fermentans]|uniref:Uncharacterized protein n=1 Tax=Paludibaculum fermentans TaxID=1473598 RepID=A0A7S7NJU8_PALFE|nr:hypothetical protein [Paludibaculum fermentans]QOY84971.1 hypothetical protein IRI77_19130 [Paludibaculum fermentans]
MNSDKYNSPHWTESDLISRLYGLDPAEGRSPAHLTECRDCSDHWQAVQARRRSVVEDAPASSEGLEERLRAQRQAVWARIERPRRPLLWRMIPATATALMIFAGVAMHQAKPPVIPVQTASAVSDAQFFNEIASVVNQETPRAADPLQGLFDSNAAPAAVEAQ